MNLRNALGNSAPGGVVASVHRSADNPAGRPTPARVIVAVMG